MYIKISQSKYKKNGVFHDKVRFCMMWFIDWRWFTLAIIFLLNGNLLSPFCNYINIKIKYVQLNTMLIKINIMDNSNGNTDEREFEEGAAGTNKERKSDPLKEYENKEPMTPSKINEGEPTAVKRDPKDQKITEPGQTGTDDENAKEQLRKRGMAKIE